MAWYNSSWTKRVKLTIQSSKVEVARMDNIARLEETRIMASASPDLVAASRRHETIEDEANKNL